MALLLTVLFVALVFEYINGFHDTANSIATVVSTKVLLPRQAIALAAITNLVGALMGVAVAKTITSGLVDATFVSTQTVICALLAGIVWNLVTWWLGLPSSSTHALVGGLCGATVASAHGQWSALFWSKVTAGKPWWENAGILYKVLIPMLTSPVIGFLVGLLMMSGLYVWLRNWRPSVVSGVFGKLQLASAAYMGWSHGLNDAQKTMGVITLALVAGTKAGVLDGAPAFLAFLKTPDMGAAPVIPLWVKVTCAVVMAAGTAAGGWRIIQTMGHKMVKLQPVHGFAAEATAASVLFVAGQFGMPVSTTHAITTSIMGVGCAKRFSAVNFPVVRRILWAWVLTIPATGLLGYLAMRTTQQFGW
jgi:PiT family inorganic phosphate transporter